MHLTTVIRLLFFLLMSPYSMAAFSDSYGEAETYREHKSSFQRTDGARINIWHEENGSVMFTSYECQFESPDKKPISVPSIHRESASICITSTKANHTFIYIYPSFGIDRFLPFAKTVLLYDGYNFLEQTSTWRVLLSPFILLKFSFFKYAFLTAFFLPISFIALFIIKRRPRHKKIATLIEYVLVTPILIFLALIYCIFVMAMSPLSPTILFLLLLSFYMLLRVRLSIKAKSEK